MKKTQLRQLIREEIKLSVNEGQDNFGMGVDFNPPSERNPSNKMIYDLVKALYELLK